MSKRGAAAFLWFAAAWMTYEILWSIAGTPRMLGPVIAASVAMIVVVDPLHLFWQRPDVPAPRPADAVPHALDAGRAKSN